MLRQRAFLFALLPFSAYLLIVFVVPTARMLARAFLEPEPGFGQFSAILVDPLYWQVFWTTLRISFFVTVISVLFGYPVAYVAVNGSPLVRNIVFAIVLVPFWTSTLVRLYGWTVIFQRTGVLNETLLSLGIISRPLKIMSTEGAVLVGIVHHMIPFMIFAIYVALKAIDPKLKSAAMILGARPARTFWKVTLPLAMPGIVAGSILVFISTVGLYVTAALMGSPADMMIANLITFQAREALNWPRAAAISTVLVVGVTLLSCVYLRFVDRAPRREAA